MKPENEFGVALGKVLRAVRLQKRLTLGQIYNIYKIPNTTMGNWENNRTSPNFESLYKLASVYGVRVSFIISMAENELKRNKLDDSDAKKGS